MKKRTLFVSFLIFTLCVFHSLTPSTVLAQEDASLAQQVFDEHKDTLLRDDVKVHLPPLLDGLKSSPLDIPTLINTAISLVTSDPTGASLKAIADSQSITLTDDHVALIKDKDVQAVLKDDTTVALLSLKGDELAAALDELAALIAVPPVVPPPVDPVPPPVDPVPPPVDPVPPPVDPVPPPVDPVPPPVDPVPPPVDPVPPPVDPVPPPDGMGGPIVLVPSNINGQSRLGGLSLNRLHGRAFIRDMIVGAGLSEDLADEYVEYVVDVILAQVPKGFLPKKQIKQVLTARRPTSIFQIDEPQLDFENFGNGITPSLLSAIFNQEDPYNQKYLTSDSLNLYVRVPSTLKEGRVEFRINDYIVGEGQRITPEQFQADTIPYVFSLEESLAATNLPAWPSLGNQIFSSVILKYSQTGLEDEYIAVDMEPVHGANGVVWESKIGILPKGNTYYYFEVTLTEPVMLEVINPEAVFEALDSKTATHNLSPTNTYTISSWSMPDPKNLQFADRGILEDLITPDVAAEVATIVLPQLGKPASEFEIKGRDKNKLARLILRNANALFTTFEENFDPRLSSVFSVPNVNIATESLWFGDIGSIDDSMGDASKIEAIVYNANGDPVDQITANVNVDTTAPTANIAIGPADENTAGYWNKDNVFVATAKDSSLPSVLNIQASDAVGVGQGQGYLLYQLIDLDADGNPVGTWLPLTPKNSMLASDIWDLIREELQGNPDPNIQLLVGLDVNALIGLLNSDIAGLAGPFLADLGIKLSDEQLSLIGSLFGAVIQDFNLIPLVFDPTRPMGMPIKGEGIPIMRGDFGIRTMGIDTVFNVGSFVAPTRLRILDPGIDPVHDTSSVTAAKLGDINYNGKDDPYENGYLYSNTDMITLTITLNERTVHPGEIMVQYQNADGVWTTIDTLELEEATGSAGDTLTVDWKVTDFQDLVATEKGYVAIQTVTTNKLSFSHTSEMFKINLDNDVHPVDPEVLIVDVDDASIVMTNQDSGAPQGTINLIGYTPRRTVPATDTIRIEAKRTNDEAWTMIGTVEGDEMRLPGTDTAAVMFNGNTLADVYTDNMLHIQDSGSYLKWIVAVDTTAIEDTITKDSPAARDASLDDNMYMVRAYAVGDDGSDISDAVEGEMYTDTFSVDNDDDVAPLGPTNVVVSSVDAMDSVFVDNGDGTYTVGGLTDKYDPNVDSPVITLTLKPEAARGTYAGVKLITSLPEDAIIGEVTETAEGSGEFTVTIDIGTLMDADESAYNDRYLQDPDDLVYNPTEDEVYTFTAHALAYDKAAAYDDATAADDMFLTYGNIQADDYDDDEITVNVQNSYRPDPGVLAITVENSDGMTNADSGAPKYELTFNAYTYGLTSPPTEGVRFEVKRPGDETWERIPGTDAPPEEIDGSDLAGIVTGLVQITEHNTVSDGAAEFAIPGSFHKWSVTVDTRVLARLGEDRPDETITLEDTIIRGDAAERDASLDDNQYQVRAISLTPKNMAHPEYHQRDGVDAHFSLDNVDDVPPLGPTNITDVADAAGSIEANEDGSYTVGGIVDPTVDTPVAIFTVEPTAEPITYEGGSIRVVQTDADGNMTETDGSLEDGTVTVDVGQLANGTYMYHALVADKFGNWQVQGELDMPSPIVTVHVLNFRVSDITDLTVTAVDGEVVEGELPDTIPLRDSISVSFNVNNGSLMVDDLTGILVDGHRVMYTAGSDAENSFSLMADELGSVVDGWYTPHGEVTKRNGSVTFPLAMINLDNTGPMVEFVTPTEGHTVNDLPTLRATYNDGDLGVGISADNTAVVGLARLRPNSDTQEEMPIDVDQGMVEQDGYSVVYTRIDKLAGGAYKFSVQVSDSLGNIGNHSVAFAVEGINPSVVITAPASGQQFDASPASITGFYSGGGEVNISKFMVNDADVTADVDGNNFTYMPDGGFSEGDHNVSVEVTDGSGLTSQTGLTFTITLPVPTVAILSPEPTQVYNHGSPIITGEFTGADPVMVALSIDGEAVEVEISGNQFSYTPEMELSHGEHSIAVEVTDANGKTAMTSTIFTVDIPGPSVAIHSPASGQTYDHGKPMLQGEFTGVEASVAVTVNDQAIPVVVDGNEFTFTPPVRIEDGEYTVVAIATDANGKTAKATSVFSVSLPVPTVAILTPTAGQVIDHGMPVISGNFSGADEIVVAATIDGETVEVSVNDNNEFTYTPADALSHGEHMIVIEVTDGNDRTAKTSSVFTVDIPGPTVAINSPASGQVFDHGMPMLQGEFTGVEASVAVTVNGQAIPVVVDGNEFTFTPPVRIEDGEYTIVATATDANGKTAKATSVFTVSLPVPTVAILTPTAGQVIDHGMPVISGNFSGADEIVVAATIDGETVEVSVNDNNEFTYTPADALSHGEHMIVIEVTDGNDRTAKTSSVFTVDIPGPTVAINSPASGQVFDHGMPMLQGEFTGVEAELTVMVNGEEIEVEVDGNEFTYTSADRVDDGDYTVVADVMDANGKTAKATAVFTVRLPEPTVTINAPGAGLTYDNGNVIIAGEFTGVAPVELKLSIDGEDAEVKVDGNQFTHDLEDALADGDHTITVEITDANDKTAKATSMFTVDIPGPSVSILSPASGQTYAHGTPVIRAEFMGSTEVNVTTFTINGEDVDGEVEDNQLTYTVDPALGDGEHTIVVGVTDANKKTAEASVVFSVMKDKTAPVISAYAPTGVVRLNKADVAAEDMGITISADISDPESDLLSVKYLIDDTAPTHSYPVDNAGNKFEITHSFNAGTHSITLIAESEGGSKEFRWTFTVEVDEAPPAISNITPSGTVQAGLPTISASATDDTGVEEMSITLMDSEGKEVKGKASDDDEDRANEGITRLDFNPDAPLEEGTYTINVRATDGYGNSSTAKGGFTVTFDTAAPIITMASPQNGSRLTYKHDEERKPNISIAYSDAGTGVNVDSIGFVLNDQLINLTSKQKSASQVNYTPPADLEPGKYVVKLEVSDNAHQQGNVSEKNKGAREANTAVYEFSFFVERGDTPIMWAAPFNYPNPFSKNTRISLVLARRANVSITIFDSTLRPVRVLVDNEVMDAGNYTKNPAGAGSNAIGWDGKSSSGEDLARGIYFCQIEVNDGIEPEFVILKLALTR